MVHIALLAAVLPAVLAAPSPASSAIWNRQAGLAPLLELKDSIPNSFIVKMKDGAASDPFTPLGGKVKYSFSNVLNGFAGTLDASLLSALRQNPNVEYVEQDSKVFASAFVTQKDAPWGLSRISSGKKAGVLPILSFLGASSKHLPGDYTYDESGGEGVCAYSIDTGVDDTHPDFEGRAKQLKSWIDGSNVDDNGHGTHTAGTIGSKTYGVAKKVRIFGYKVLDAGGSGATSGIVAAYDELARDAPTRNCKGVVVNLSLGSLVRSETDNAAAAALVAKGYFLSVAAGNSGIDASLQSPASEPTVCTVGATDADDRRAYYSNFGSVVDIFAPGSAVISTVPGGGTKSLSGTSMAAPHIAGLAAYLIGLDKATSVNACDKIKDLATKNAVGLNPPLTTNSLAFNGNPSAPQ